jgi:hypothetical protein
MSDVKNWPIRSKTSVTSDEYIPLTGMRRLQAQALFPSLATTGTGGENLYVNVTNANQLNFKGLLSGTTGMLSVSTVTNNLVLSILPAGIDLDLCDNTTAGFLSSVNLTANVTGVLPTANGGTGLSTFAKGAIFYASDDDVMAGTSPLSNGQLLVGNASTGLPTPATLTAGANVTVTNGPGTITIAANLSTLAAVLDTDIYNINLNAAAGTSWISGDGSDEGLYVDANGRVFMGDSTPVPVSLSAQLTLGGISSDVLNIGNNNSYGNRRIKMVNASGAYAGADLAIEGADGGTGNQVGGAINLMAGSGTGTSKGGTARLIGGNSVGGDPGDVEIGNMKGASFQKAIIVDKDANVKLNSGYLAFTKTPQTLVGPGAVDVISQITHVETTGVNALTLADGIEGQTKMIVMTVDGGNGTMTPVNPAGYSTIGFHDVGESVHLLFTGGKWFIIGQFGVTIT